ncbi:MAG: hypothetical protein A3J79_02290 [Elusimicrobia bacterium RIFOXYB2_FULL_62_6]|nr:MAG: hypothetical protein A3J79_02290 [Elusimicrobia bacterium RIFOXYB2_FULL_62_6]
MKLHKIGAGLLTAGLLCGAAGLVYRAQAEGEDYKAMLEDAMKSGKYTLNQVESWDPRLKRVAGSVKVKRPDSEEWTELKGEVPLEASDLIKTGADGLAELYLDDKAAIVVGRSTEFELATVAKTDTAFILKVGFLAGKIGRLLNEKHQMQVRAPSAVCVMRGSEFAVQFSKLGKETGAAVFNDEKMTVTPSDEKGQSLGEYVLEKNTELTFTPDQRRVKTAPLAKMRRFTAQVSEMRLRIATLKKTWKPINQTKRQALRDRVFKRVSGKNFAEEEEDAPVKPKKKAKAKAKPKKTVKKAAQPKPAYDEAE